MIDLIFTDLADAVLGVVQNNSMLVIGALIVAIIGKGFLMEKPAEVFGRTAQALLLTVLLLFVVAGFTNPDRLSLSGWLTHIQGSWISLMGTQVQTLLGFYLVALVGVGAVFGIKKVIRR